MSWSKNTPFVTAAALLLGAALLAGCGERPPIDTVQRGYRGTGIEQVYNPRLVEAQAPLNQVPPGTPPTDNTGPKARDVYQNVRVLGDLSVAEFSRHMAAITQWVSPTEGCTYCHVAANFADDSKYQKIVSRRMIQMTQHVNADWKLHVQGTGVTCYTCHRGNPVPPQVWYQPARDDQRGSGFMGNLAGQNQADPANGIASLPFDPFTPYLKDALPIRVASVTALPTGNRSSIKQTEFTYALMMHMSKSLGVNCTYCHNTRSLGGWDNAPPQRVSAYYGIRLARDINGAYLEGLMGTLPAQRLGPTGDVPKANCATCHQGAFKPLYGAQMAKDYIGLLAVAGPAVPAVSPAAAPVPTPEAAGPGLPAAAPPGTPSVVVPPPTGAAPR